VELALCRCLLLREAGDGGRLSVHKQKRWALERQKEKDTHQVPRVQGQITNDNSECVFILKDKSFVSVPFWSTELKCTSYL